MRSWWATEPWDDPGEEPAAVPLDGGSVVVLEV